MKRWATAKEIHEDILPGLVYDELNNTTSKLAALARQGRIERRLGERMIPAGPGNYSKSQIWEYYVPQARSFFMNNRRGHRRVAVSKARGQNLATSARVTARIN